MFGAKLRELREKRGLSQGELAEMIGLDRRRGGSYLYQLETGRIRMPRIESLKKIAEALGVPPAELLASEGLYQTPQGVTWDELRMAYRILRLAPATREVFEKMLEANVA